MKKSVKNPIDIFLRQKLHLAIDNDLLKDAGFTMDDERALWCELRPTYDYWRFEYGNAGNKACVRKQGFNLHKFNKFEEKELMKVEKRILEKFVAFMDVIEDDYPQYCFISGMYVPPRFKGNLAVKPFKNGEWCYKQDYDRYLNHNVVSDKVFSNSMLICIATGLYPSKMIPRTVRPRIPNNIESFVKHVNANPDGFNTHDKNRFLEQPHALFTWFRFKYFLKPNGKPFPRVR